MPTQRVRIGYEIVKGRPANTNIILTLDQRERLPEKFSFIVRGPGGRVLVDPAQLQAGNAKAWFDTEVEARHHAENFIRFVINKLRQLPGAVVKATRA